MRPRPKGMQVTRRSTFRYGDHRDQQAELVRRAGGRLPVAVVLHGGFWRDRYDRKLMDPLCDDLADAGWAAWNLEYRRLPDGGWPATFEDVAAAIDLLADVATPEALDLHRMVTIGHSAGGHLALWAAARHRLPDGAPGARPRVRVTHAVAQAGVADLAEADRLELGGGVVRELLRGRVAELTRLTSPAELAPLGVPQLLVHGEADEVVPHSLVRRYASRAREAGDEVELVVEPGVGHFEHLDPASLVWSHVRRWLTERT